MIREQRRRPRPAVASAAAFALAVSAFSVLASCSEPARARLPPGVVATTPAARPTPGPTGGTSATAGTVSDGAVPAGRGPLELGPPGVPAVPAGVRTAVSPYLSAAALGADPGVVVLDPGSGRVLSATDATVGVAPASTAKLLIATAVLDRWGAAHRFSTRVLLTGRSGEVADLVLVGGGDPSLTAATGAPGPGSGDEDDDPVTGPARLSALVAQTVAALGTPSPQVRVAVDDHVFTGASTTPDWPSSYVAGGFVGPVDALSLDGGRVGPDGLARVPDPALAAGRVFAAELRAAGIPVAGTVARQPAAVGTQLAAVSSPRLVDLVRHMLLASDNDYAETLLRQVAAGSAAPASFAGSVAAVLARLRGLGVATTGVHLDDGSGLSRDDRIPPLVLAHVLAAALRDPALAGVPRSLPVAGRSGTLTDRFTGAAAVGRGRVLAKTGTLTGVDDLAGYVLTLSAGTLVVVVMAGATSSAVAAESAIDLLVSRVVRCGCHR